ncbi:MAG TPA: hypothetical protein VK468_04440 [Pyrinomonadaceae bacterium]|nr:hypothetical protein [Pyrinomonadaceae bacterium]
MADQNNKNVTNIDGGTSPKINDSISQPGASAPSGQTNAAPGSGAATATARSFYDQAKETAGQAYEAVTDKAAATIDERKSTLSDGLTSVAETIRQAGDKLTGPETKSGITETAAKYTDTAAQKLEQAANYFEQKDVRQMVRDAEDYARRNPAVFIAAAFGAGVLIARFLKAGSPAEEFMPETAKTPLLTTDKRSAAPAGGNVRDFSGSDTGKTGANVNNTSSNTA